jgi:hypothetical protein
MPDQSVLLDQVRRYFEYAGADVDRAQELYHDDAVLEFRSRASGSKASPTSVWRRQYPAEVRYRLRRVTAREDLVVVEVSASYNGGPWQYRVQSLVEAHDEWQVTDRRYLSEGSMALLTATTREVARQLSSRLHSQQR